MEDAGMGDKYYPIRMRLLCYYCNPNNTFHRYTRFYIRKKTPGEYRQISAPCNKSYKALLHYLNELLKAVYTPSAYAFGFTEGRSVVDNAQRHKGMNYVFNTDIENFFPSIEQPRVWKRLQLPPFSFPVTIASTIAGLCCMRTQEPDNHKKGFCRCVLPQGAPTSPLITNTICDTLDRRLHGLAKRFGLNYSRYADDITFSSMHNVYQEGGDFRKELQRIIEDQHFKMNERKTRLQERGERQEVTGITVNEKLNVTQKYVRDIRNLLYIWRRYGESDAILSFFQRYKSEKGHVKRGFPDMVNVLDGKLMYLKMVKGGNDSVYMRLRRQFEQLVATRDESYTMSDNGVTYIETLPVPEFEKKHKTQVVIVPSTIHKTAESSKNGSGRRVRRSGKARYAYFKMDESVYKASVDVSIKKEEENKVEEMYISCCRDAKGRQFWYVHRPQPYRHRETTSAIDIDQLNADLENLLA
jgi:RNA-directed DNA polymerase